MKFYSVMFSVLLLFPLFLAAEGDRQVEIYSAAQQSAFGQSLNRTRIESHPLSGFRMTMTMPAGEGGILTAVLVDGRVERALAALLADRNFVFVENSALSKSDRAENTYIFSWEDQGFEIEFGLEKAGESINRIIDETYRDNAYLKNEVRKSYKDNWVVRIYRAEDIRRSSPGKIDFHEAMLSASVIGDSFQPLLGIRDGLAVLDEIGIIKARVDIATDSELVEYRQFEEADDELRSFVQSIETMTGDFIDNLYKTVGDIFRRHTDDGDILLPEQFFGRKSGDNTDFAVFYYDVLKRMGYDVRFVIIDSGLKDTELYSTVFFKETGADLWGRIDSHVLEREKAGRLSRMPALVFSSTVRYIEPNLEEIFASAELRLPPPSAWRTSLY